MPHPLMIICGTVAIAAVGLAIHSPLAPSLGSVSAPQAAIAPDAPQEPRPHNLSPIALQLDKPISVDVRSTPVEWNGNSFHLVRIHQVVFHRDGDRLTATVEAAILTFDNVDYRVSMAVFDEAGRLLGTAATTCDVERLWLGQFGAMKRTLEFDFEVSRAFARGASFSLAVADREVLTPNDWQKDG